MRNCTFDQIYRPILYRQMFCAYVCVGPRRVAFRCGPPIERSFSGPHMRAKRSPATERWFIGDVDDLQRFIVSAGTPVVRVSLKFDETHFVCFVYRRPSVAQFGTPWPHFETEGFRFLWNRSSRYNRKKKKKE